MRENLDRAYKNGHTARKARGQCMRMRQDLKIWAGKRTLQLYFGTQVIAFR